MSATDSILREDHVTIGRYAIQVEGSSQPAIISYTRPRARLIYITYARMPEVDSAPAAMHALVERVVSDARERGDKVVLTTAAVAELFSEKAFADCVIAA